MSRDIKFRAWDTSSSGWCGVDMAYQEAFGHGPISKPVVFDGQGKCIIMQYTGLKDKNGVEIYEGDILRCGGDTLSSVEEVSIEEHPSAGLRVQYGYPRRHNFPAPHWVEVIGNIYENPELLKESKSE